MKKLVITMLLAITSLTLTHAQLVYKVSGNGLSKPSYLIGTHHLAPIAMIEQLSGIREALNNSEQVYGELDLNTLNSPASLKKIENSQLLPEGKTLMGLLTKEQGQKLDNILKELMGAGMSNPKVEAKMNKMTPMAMLINLNLLSYLRNHMGEFDATASIDKYFQTQAKANNLPVGGLESLDFQMNLLYKRMSLEREVQLLMCFIDHLDFYELQAEELTNAYKRQDLNELLTITKRTLNEGCDATPEEWNALTDQRNEDWAKRMPAIMKVTPTLFAVGAAHLPGEKGVLQLLKDAGYTIEAVQ